MNCCRPEQTSRAALLADVARRYKLDGIIREEHVAKYGHARRPVGVEMNGKMWVMIDDSIYLQTQEGPYNFVNAVHDHALHFFGEKMLEIEEGKDFADRHPAIQWMHAHVESYARDQNTYQSGNGAAWYRFAYDLFTIRDNAKLQDDLKERLLNPNSFQAARHELKVAALSATAGFDLGFEDERDNKRRHPEFVGVDRLTGAKIAVEAKSRHRRGVLGFAGGLDLAPSDSVGARSNILDAYKKKPEFPFYVFIDVNLPPAQEGMMQRWERELEQTMQDLDAEGYASPCPANAIIFTNDPSHYVGGELVGRSDDKLWVRSFTAKEPAIPHPSNQMTERLLTAYTQRVAGPSDFHEVP